MPTFNEAKARLRQKILSPDHTPDPKDRFDTSELVPEESAWESALRYLGRPGYAVRDALTGNLEGAGRQVADLVGDTADAFLPGDWIPEASRRGQGGGPNDYTEGSDLLEHYGVDKFEPGLGKLAADIGVGLVTDPLTYLGLGEVGAAAKAAKGLEAVGEAANAGKAGSRALTLGIPFLDSTKVAIPGSEYLTAGVGKAADLLKSGVQAVPGGGKLLEAGNELGHGIRKTFAALRPTEKIAQDVASSEATGGLTRQAAQSFPVEALSGIDPDTQRRAIEMIRGVSSEMIGPGYHDLGIAPAAKFINPGEQALLINRRIARMPWDEPTKQAVREATGKITDYTQGLWRQGVRDKVFSQPEGIAATLHPADYLPGRYDMHDVENILPTHGNPALPSPIKGKEITNSADLANYLSSEGGKLDADVPKILGQYGEKMGQATQAAQIGAKTLGDEFKALSDPESRAAMGETIDNLRKAGQLDDAHVLETTFKGVPPRGKFAQMLADRTKIFKEAATVGVLVPNMNFNVRNIIAGVWQALSNKEARGEVGGVIKRVIPNIFGSLGDGLSKLGVSAIPESRFAEVAKAAAASGGTRDGMLRLIKDPVMKQAVQHGVLDGGFVGTEALTAKIKSGWKDNALHWGSAIAQGAEQRMRFGLFKDLLKTHSAEDAARIVKDTQLDYKLASAANRNMRDVIPFFQFTAKTIPQTVNFLKEQPAIAGAIRPLYTQDDPQHPVYPYLNNQPVVPLGDKDYLTSFGLPFEVMGQIPNLSDDLRVSGRQARQDLVGSSQPLLKTAYSYLSGRDPTFDSPWLGYDKNPAIARALGAGESSEAARYLNAAEGTGLIQPLTSALNAVGKAVNPDLSPASRALGATTGLRVVDVDEDRAVQQLLDQYLSKNPSIRQRTSYYKKGDEEVAAINRLLGDMGRKAKKQAEIDARKHALSSR